MTAVVGRVHVRQLEGRVHVAGGGPAALAARARAETALGLPFRRALGAAFAASGLDAAPGVALLDAIRIDVALADDESAEDAAARWARAVALHIRGRIAAAPGFRHAADHLAFFVAETLAGRRDDRLAFRPFAGYAAMPASAAVRAALTARPGICRAALARLGDEQRAALADLLPPDDARLLLSTLEAEIAAPRGIPLVLTRSLADAAATRRTDAGAALALLLGGSNLAGTPGHHLRPGETLLLGRALRRLHPLAARARAALLAQASAGPDTVAALERDAAKAVAALSPKLRETLGTLEAAGPAARREEVSPRAGFAMLVPALATLTEHLPDQDAPAAGRLRLDLLAQTAGPEADATRDPVLRLLAGLPPHAEPPEPGPELLAHLDDGAEPPDPAGEGEAALLRASASLLRAFAAHIAGFEQVSPAFLVENFLATPGQAWIEASCLKVRFHPAPIDAALALAGLNRGKFALPWRPHRLDFAPEDAP